MAERNLYEWFNRLNEDSDSPKRPPKVLSLRLADVIGPFDNTKRFWLYLIWAKLAKNKSTKEDADKFKILINNKEHLNNKFSFTFSLDVIRVIIT